MKPLLSNTFGAERTIPVQFIALGAGDSYYLKYEETKKDPVFDLAGKYTALKEYLGTKPKISVRCSSSFSNINQMTNG